MTEPNFLIAKEPSKIEKILRHPSTQFIYGVMWFSGGLMSWYGQGLTNLFIDIGISPLIGILITGMYLCIGFCFMGGNYSEFIKTVKGLHLFGSVNNE